MSGGSYDYFHSRFNERMRSVASTLDDMADVLTNVAQGEHWQQEKFNEHGRTGEFVKPPADDVQALAEMANDLTQIAQLQNNLRERLVKLERVLHAVEWFESGDFGIDSLVAVVKEARKA